MTNSSLDMIRVLIVYLTAVGAYPHLHRLFTGGPLVLYR